MRNPIDMDQRHSLEVAREIGERLRTVIKG